MLITLEFEFDQVSDSFFLGLREGAANTVYENISRNADPAEKGMVQDGSTTHSSTIIQR